MSEPIKISVRYLSKLGTWMKSEFTLEQPFDSIIVDASRIHDKTTVGTPEIFGCIDGNWVTRAKHTGDSHELELLIGRAGE